ncbi:MAG: transposase [Caldilineaceae bacterium]|nr:transposase [Caldilineaceae bacterium]
MLLSFKYRLYPNTEQRQLLERTLEIHRQLYNDALTERRLAWEKKRVSVRYIDQANQLKTIRQFDMDAAWVNYTSIQQTLRRLQKSFDGFFRRIKAGEKAGHPRYKGRGWFKSVAYVYGDGCRWVDGRFYMQRIGSIRLFQHRPLPDSAKIKQAVLKRDGVGNWHVVFQIEIPDTESTSTLDSTVGIDMGLEYFASLSSGEQIDNPRWYRIAEAKLAKLQKMRARCKRGSHRNRELKRQIQRHHEQTANRRRDFHHKTSNKLANRFSTLYVEALNVKGLAMSHVSKSIADAGWRQFLFMLSYKAERAGGRVEQVDARGTSQYCPECGGRVEKSLSVRVHNCPHCGYVAPRDVAAAQVIAHRGSGRTDPRRKESHSQGVCHSPRPRVVAGSSLRKLGEDVTFRRLTLGFVSTTISLTPKVKPHSCRQPPRSCARRYIPRLGLAQAPACPGFSSEPVSRLITFPS